MKTSLTTEAVHNVHSIIHDAFVVGNDSRAMIVYDRRSELAMFLFHAYQKAIPNAQLIECTPVNKSEVLKELRHLPLGSLVILIQSDDFRLNEFRIRIELFSRGLQVIEHQHLNRHAKSEWPTFVRALHYDKSWYKSIGEKIKNVLDTASTLQIENSNTRLEIQGSLEEAKLNIGDYTNIKNKGGTFPIGEVFTEACHLESAQGELEIYAFAGNDFKVEFYEPFRITIVNGLLTRWSKSAPHSFTDIMKKLTTVERPFLREIGFGLNRAITKQTPLYDITSYERNYGLHVSVGEKHSVYKKKNIKADKARFHIDLFPSVTRVATDTALIWENDRYAI